MMKMMKSSFRVLLENNSTIDNLWITLTSKVSINSRNCIRSFDTNEYYLYLILADAYEDLGHTSISNALRHLYSNRKCPSEYINGWGWSYYGLVTMSNLSKEFITAMTIEYPSNFETYISNSNVYFSSFKEAMLAACNILNILHSV